MPTSRISAEMKIVLLERRAKRGVGFQVVAVPLEHSIRSSVIVHRGPIRRTS